MSKWYKTERLFITAKSKTSLLELLSEHLPERYDPKTAIDAGGVWKDRKRLMNHNAPVNPKETVKVHTSPFQGKRYTLDPAHVIFENHDFMVVYKPCDLNVHAVPSSIHYNLMYGVNQYLDKQGTGFEANPVTRLDRPVEGLVIFPKNKSSERKLFEKTKNRRIKKWYMGALERRKKQQITDSATGPDIRSSSKKYRRVRDYLATDGKKTFQTKDGKFSDTLFIKVKEVETADIYSIFIFTGRRHQIRFHAANYLSPIVGDKLYGSSTRMPPDEIALLCRGYNIPYGKGRIKVRLPHHFIDGFYKKLDSGFPPETPSSQSE